MSAPKWFAKFMAWFIGLGSKYRRFRFDLFVDMTSKGQPQRGAIEFSDGKPKRVYDSYTLALSPRDTSKPAVGFLNDGENGEWYKRNDVSFEIERVEFRESFVTDYQPQLIHNLYDKAIEYQSPIWPWVKRNLGLVFLHLLIILYIRRPLYWFWRKLVRTTNARIAKPERDRFSYLKACLNLGYEGNPVHVNQVVDAVYGGRSFETSERVSRGKIARLVLKSLSDDGAIDEVTLSGLTKVRGRALSLYQEMAEGRQRKVDELNHNSQIRVLTGILALGVILQIIEFVNQYEEEGRMLFDRYIGAYGFSPGEVSLVSLAVLVIVVWLKGFVIRQRSKPEIDF